MGAYAIMQTMFLSGGPAFCGTTLLALLLNQKNVVCLDEPDFHNPQQNHRGIPFLKRLFPSVPFPEPFKHHVSFEEAVQQIEECEKAIGSCNLGIKTCNAMFLQYATIYKKKGYPVICLFRDIRDVLVTPLPDWISENSLNAHFRSIWNSKHLFDFWFRYEDLVEDPGPLLERISRILGVPLQVLRCWNAEEVHAPMLKLDRHHLLSSGSISGERTGLWKSSELRFSDASYETAEMMGYL